MSAAFPVLVDGSAYFLRCLHQFASSLSVDGIPSGASKAVINIVNRLRQQHPHAHLIVALEFPGESPRAASVLHYRSLSHGFDEELLKGYARLRDSLEAMGVCVVSTAGLESCDLLASLAEQAGDDPVIISSPSLRLACLINERRTLCNTLRGEHLDSVAIQERFGISAPRMTDWLALVGDSSEGIPTISGFTPEIASALLKQTDSLLDVLHSPEMILEFGLPSADRLARFIAEHPDQVVQNHALARLYITDQIGQVAPPPHDVLSLHRLYCLQNFSQWAMSLREIPEVALTAPLVDAEMAILAEEYEARRRAAEAAGKAQDEQVDLHDESVTLRPRITRHILDNDIDLRAWVDQLRDTDQFAIGIDTDRAQAKTAKLVGISLCLDNHAAAYIPLGHDPELAEGSQLKQRDVLRLLKPLIESPDILKVSRRSKFDQTLLTRHGLRPQGFVLDVPLLSYTVNTTGAPSHTIDGMTHAYLGLHAITYRDVAGGGSKQPTMDKLPIDKAARYCCEMACLTWRLEAVLTPLLNNTPRLRQLYDTLELPLIPVLDRMESAGAKVDTSALALISQDLGSRMDHLKSQMFEMVGEPFNLSSPAQIGQAMHNILGMPVLRKTKRNVPSTNEVTLTELAEQGHQFPPLLLEYRSLDKLQNTYATGLPKQVNADTGCIHPTYQQAVAVTGRLSCTDPNLMSIPKHSTDGQRIREAFVARQGYKLVCADYSQIELRIMGHFAQDRGLMGAFRQDLDIHQATAAEIFDTPLDLVTAEQRQHAKAINFGLIYGMSAFGLAQKLDCNRQKAAAYIQRYFTRYPGVKRYMDRVRQQARQTGYVETLFGRRMYLPDIKERGQARMRAERAAINAPMQGTVADIIKRSMLHVDAWITQSGVPARIILQVHDELVLEVAESHVTVVTERLHHLMCAVPELSVPLKIEIGVGDNWGQAH